MPAKGMSERARNRFKGLFLQDEAKIERQSGRGDGGRPGVPTYENLGTFNCKMIPRSAITFGPNGVSQAYDAQVIIGAGPAILDRSKRYRVTVTQYKSHLETDEAVPQVKATYVLDTVSIDLFQDAAGTDNMLLLRCVNGR